MKSIWTFLMGITILMFTTVLYQYSVQYSKDRFISRQLLSKLSLLDQRNNEEVIEEIKEEEIIQENGIGQNMRKCSLEKGEWNNLPATITQCAQETSEITVPGLLYFNMGRLHEKKYFFHLRQKIADWLKEPSGSTRHPIFGTCWFLTVGIGGDFEVEKEVKEMYPKCQIAGIEASPAQIGNFTNFGIAIPHAVGLQEGEAKLKIRAKGSYYTKTMRVVPFLELLDTYMNGTRFIYFMTIDLEGFEFNILEGLFKSNVLSNGGLVICQIDAELHGNRKASFPQFWSRMLKETPYVPIASAKFLSHRKVTFVHTRDERCNAIFPIDTVK